MDNKPRNIPFNTKEKIYKDSDLYIIIFLLFLLGCLSLIFKNYDIIILSIILYVILIPFLISSIKEIKKELKLLRYGRIINAQIKKINYLNGHLFAKKRIEIFFEYELDEKTFNRKDFVYDLSLMDNRNTGDLIPIIISNENLNESFLIFNYDFLKRNWLKENSKTIANNS